jgi:hypothetical protein
VTATPVLCLLRLVKRSRALRGRNPMRNSQVKGAPRAQGLPAIFSRRKPLLFSWTPLPSLQNPIPNLPTVASSRSTSFPPCRAHWIVTHSCRQGRWPVAQDIVHRPRCPIRTAVQDFASRDPVAGQQRPLWCATQPLFTCSMPMLPARRVLAANAAAASNRFPRVSWPPRPAQSSRQNASARECRSSSRPRPLAPS